MNSQPTQSQNIFFESTMIQCFTAIALLVLTAAIPISGQTLTWQPTNGPMGGNIWSLEFSHSGNLFAGTRTGVYRTTNSGDGWSATGQGLPVTDVFIFSTDTAGNILAGTHDGIYRSTDDGQHWLPAIIGLSNRDVRTLARDSTGYLFAGTGGGGVFRSTNNGASWNYSGLSGSFLSTIVVNANNDIFSGTFGGGVYRSTNHGVGWQQVNTAIR